MLTRADTDFVHQDFDFGGTFGDAADHGGDIIQTRAAGAGVGDRFFNQRRGVLGRLRAALSQVADFIGDDDGKT